MLMTAVVADETVYTAVTSCIRVARSILQDIRVSIKHLLKMKNSQNQRNRFVNIKDALFLAKILIL